MSSVQSILIRTCMSSIQKELEQLEKWLGGPLPQPEPRHSTDSLLTAVERLSKQFEVQQHALNHIIDRLDILEGVRNEPCYMDLHDDPWLDHSPTQLQNEIIDPIEPLYHIRKTDTLFEPAPSPHHVEPLTVVEQPPLAQPVVQPLAQSVVEQQPVVQPLAQPVVQHVVEESSVSLVPQSVVEEQQQEPPKEQQEQQEEEQQEEAQEEDEQHEVEQQEEQQQEVEQQEESTEEQEEEQEEEEEDESVELIEYKGVSYYKDAEGFIYTIEEDDQPSEIAVGYWKEKTNSIAFYKK
jgi:hypothetical protein